MGFFSKKVFKNNNENTSEQEAQKRVNEDGSEWIQKAYKTSKSFNDEDMGGARRTEASTHLHRSGGQRGKHIPYSFNRSNQQVTASQLPGESSTAGRVRRDTHPGGSCKDSSLETNRGRREAA